MVALVDKRAPENQQLNESCNESKNKRREIILCKRSDKAESAHVFLFNYIQAKRHLGVPMAVATTPRRGPQKKRHREKHVMEENGKCNPRNIYGYISEKYERCIRSLCVDV